MIIQHHHRQHGQYDPNSKHYHATYSIMIIQNHLRLHRPFVADSKHYHTTSWSSNIIIDNMDHMIHCTNIIMQHTASWSSNIIIDNMDYKTNCDNFPYKNLAVLDYCDHDGSDPVYLIRYKYQHLKVWIFSRDKSKHNCSVNYEVIEIIK